MSEETLTANVRRVVEQVTGDDAPPRAAIIAPDGYGRTETLSALAATLREQQRDVVEVGARRLEQGVAYGALETLLETTPRSGTKGEQRARAAVVDRLVASGATLFVDDAHWLDPSSHRVLVGLAERPGDGSFGFVAAHRPVAGHADLAALDAALATRIPPIRLEPLGDGGVAERAARVLRAAVDDALVDAVMVRTEGVPVFVDALLRAWADAGRLDRGSLREAAPADPPVPVVELVRTRVDQLPETERRLLVALSLGSVLDDELLATLCDVPGAALGAATGGLRAAGLLVPGHDEALPIVAQAVLAITPDAERRHLHGRVATAFTARGDPPARAAEHVIAAGATGSEAAVTLIAAADAALAESPAVARELLEHAVDAGATDVGGRHAEAAALTGDLDTAVELADGALVAASEQERARALAAMGGALGSRGLWSRAVQVLTSVRGHPDLPDEVFALLAVPGLVAQGRPDEATAVLESATRTLRRPAPLAVEAVLGAARGAIESGRGALAAALDAFGDAADLLDTAPLRFVLPDTPHALGALVATAACDFSLAEQLLANAVEHDVGPALRPRHRLLLAWVAVRQGRWAGAEAVLDEVKARGLPTRDRLLRAAVDVALARRAGDVARLATAWEDAEPVLVRAHPGLFALEPVAELVVAGTRLGAATRVAPLLHDLGSTIARLGDPPLWRLPLAWARLDAAVVGDDSDVVASAAEAVASIVPAHGRLAGLAPAARAWADLYAGTVDRAALDAAAAGLTAAGLVWEASRLTGQAAIRSTDPALTRSLLERARGLKDTLPSGEARERPAGASALSEREQEVAAHVLDGLTHKEIGALLFISPKTVEHHVARIRQKLGAGTRAEMLAALRFRRAG